MRKNQNEVHYTPLKHRNGRAISAFFVAVALLLIVTKNPYSAAVIIPLAICGYFFGTSVLRPKCFAIIKKSGIHIIYKGNLEVHKINWTEICGCYYIQNPSYYHSPYVALVREAGMKSKDLFMMRQSYPDANLILKYRFDEGIEQLVQNQMAKKAFALQDIYLLAASQKEYSKIKCLWQQGKAS